MAKPTGAFISACRRRRADHTPVWFMRQAGRCLPSYRELRRRYGMVEMYKDPGLSSKVTLMPVEQLGVDAAIVFADIMTPLEGMGVKFEIGEGGPAVERPVDCAADVEGLERMDPHVDTAYVMESIRRSVAALEGRVPLIGFSGAPFTLAAYMVEGTLSRDLGTVKRFMHDEPDAWDALMRLLADVVLDYSRAQVESGAGAIQIFDSWAGSLSPTDYRQHVLPYTKRIFDGLSDAGAVGIYFSTGTAGMLKAIKDTGAEVIGVDWRMDIGDAWSSLGRVAIQGNLDPATMMCGFPMVKAEACRILERVGGAPGHIFSLGHGLLPDTPIGNIKALVRLVHGSTGGK